MDDMDAVSSEEYMSQPSRDSTGLSGPSRHETPGYTITWAKKHGCAFARCPHVFPPLPKSEHQTPDIQNIPQDQQTPVIQGIPQERSPLQNPISSNDEISHRSSSWNPLSDPGFFAADPGFHPSSKLTPYSTLTTPDRESAYYGQSHQYSTWNPQAGPALCQSVSNHNTPGRESAYLGDISEEDQDEEDEDASFNGYYSSGQGSPTEPPSEPEFIQQKYLTPCTDPFQKEAVKSREPAVTFQSAALAGNFVYRERDFPRRYLIGRQAVRSLEPSDPQADDRFFLNTHITHYRARQARFPEVEMSATPVKSESQVGESGTFIKSESQDWAETSLLQDSSELPTPESSLQEPTAAESIASASTAPGSTNQTSVTDKSGIPVEIAKRPACQQIFMNDKNVLVDIHGHKIKHTDLQWAINQPSCRRCYSQVGAVNKWQKDITTYGPDDPAWTCGPCCE